jgi:hypothetical protein
MYVGLRTWTIAICIDNEDTDFSIVVGYPYGGFLYGYVGHSAPFILTNMLVAIDIGKNKMLELSFPNSNYRIIAKYHCYVFINI